MLLEGVGEQQYPIFKTPLSQWENTTEHHVKTSTGILVIVNVLYVLHSTFILRQQKKWKACMKLLSMYDGFLDDRTMKIEDAMDDFSFICDVFFSIVDD